jgi:hypothetical protein
MRLCLAVIAATVLALPFGIAHCQDRPPQALIRVRLAVKENTNSVIWSAFASALRALGDVELVESDSAADFRVGVLSACLPDPDDCQRSTSSIVSITTVRTISLLEFGLAAGESLKNAADFDIATATSAYWSLMRPYGRLEEHALARWGRNAFDRGARAWVADFDRGCLQLAREVRRARTAVEVEKAAIASRPSCSGGQRR